MIPKIIHYCWFGKGLMPQSQKDCIKGWSKLMPDYKIIRWDESNFDINTCSFTKHAYQEKKFAMVSDVARFIILNKMGGIYLDTDVEVFQKFDNYLNCNFFSAVELYREFETEKIIDQLNDELLPKGEKKEIPHLEILTSTIGATPNNPLIQDCMNLYINFDANPEKARNSRDYINHDRMVALMATKYGFRYKDETQLLDNNMIIYGTGIFGHAFCVNPKYSVSYHHNAASWKDNKTKKQKRDLILDKIGLLSIKNKVKNILKGLLRKTH